MTGGCVSFISSYIAQLYLSSKKLYNSQLTTFAVYEEKGYKGYSQHYKVRPSFLKKMEFLEFRRSPFLSPSLSK